MRRRLDLLRDNFPFAIVATVEVVLIASVLWGVLEFERATDRRGESRATLASIDAALIALIDAETGERGYVITRDEAFLEPYEAARDRLGMVLTSLERDLADDPIQRTSFTELLPLIVERLADMQRSIDARRSGDEEAVEQAIADGEGRVLMDEIRGLLGGMRDFESSRLRQRIDAADRTGRFIGVASVALALATLAVVGWLFFMVRRRRETEHLRAVAHAKDEFVGFVSHELRSPIAIIAGNAWLMREGDQSPEHRVATDEVAESAERLQDVVETLLSLASAEAGKHLEVEPILLQRVLPRSVAIHRQRNPGSTVEIGPLEDLPPALGNRRAVEQVVLNLLSNAEKYGEPTAPIRVLGSYDEREVEVSVRNAGRVLDEVEFSQVFEPFFRSPSDAASAPGIGLGLTVCHRLVSGQGGRMEAHTLAGGGAEFSFSLPAIAPEEME